LNNFFSYDNILDAVSDLEDKLDFGQHVYIRRNNKWTKELLGVKISLRNDKWEPFYSKEPKVDMEFESAFFDALSIKESLNDDSSRGLVGYPKTNNGEMLPCVTAIQLLLRKPIPICLVFYRSLNLSKFLRDWSKIAKLTMENLGETEIIFLIGSFHKEEETLHAL